MNENWTKVMKMSNSEDNYNLHEYRISQLEKSHEAFRQDIKDIKELATKMEKRLSFMPDGGLGCNIHQMKMEDFGKRLVKVEDSTESLTKRIVTWSAVFAVVLFLLAQVVIPYAVSNFKIVHNQAIATSTAP